MNCLGVSVPWKSAKAVKDYLDGENLLLKSAKTFKTDDRTRVVFPLRVDGRDGAEEEEESTRTLKERLLTERLPTMIADYSNVVVVVVDTFEFERRKSPRRPSKDDDDNGGGGGGGVRARIVETLERIVERLEERSFDDDDDDETPKLVVDGWRKRTPKFSWERHGDLILLPRHPCFNFLESELGFRDWDRESMLRLVRVLCPGCNRLAVGDSVLDDGFRSPRVHLLLGESSLVRHRDNGILYEYDVRKCMFSSGNITEKLRVAKFPCQGRVVVDLFAGIGYFTLPYLVQAKADHVYACEWNPNSIKALRNNLKLNGVGDRCTVLAGDNRFTCPVGVAHRLNLGLLPSAEASFPVAARALKWPRNEHDVRWIHVHANVDRGAKDTRNLMERDERDLNTRLDGDSFPYSRGNLSCNKLRIPTTWIHWAEETKTKFQDLLNRRKEEEMKKPEEKEEEEEEEEDDEEENEEENEEEEEEEEEEELGITNARKDGEISWNCAIAHIEHVKSYGPKVDHLVLDLKCRLGPF